MQRIDEETYTENIAAIAVAPTIRRSYNKHISLRAGSVKLKGPGITLDVNVAQRCLVDWAAYHPDLENHLPAVLYRAFPDVELPSRYRLQVHNSMSLSMLDDAYKLTIRTRGKTNGRDEYDYVSLHHDDATEILDCYYVQVMLIFKLASPTQNNQAWIMVKLFKTVSTTVVEHAKMNRIHVKAEAPFRRYGIFPATSILDKEHVLPDFSSNGKCFFVGKYMFF